MINTEYVVISVTGKKQHTVLTAKQNDTNSHKYICSLSDNSESLIDTDIAKAIASIHNKTIDVIDCTIDVKSQTISFILSEKCLYTSGLLSVDISIFNGTAVKLTCSSLIINVIKSADMTINPQYNYGKSLFQQLFESSTIGAGLYNFTANTLMLNSKGFETTDNYTVVDNPTEFSTVNDWLKITTANKSGVYGKLSKTIDLWGDGRQLLVKLRVKTSKSGAKIYPVRRLNGNNGTYIDSFCVVSSNLTTINTMSHWVLPDTNWHDLWLIIKGNTSDGYELNEVGVFIQSPDNTATTVYVQQFDVFFNNDTAECTGATEEQLKQIQNNTALINKLTADVTAEIAKINSRLDSGSSGMNVELTYDESTEALTIQSSNENIAYDEETENLTIGGA